MRAADQKNVVRVRNQRCHDVWILAVPRCDVAGDCLLNRLDVRGVVPVERIADGRHEDVVRIRWKSRHYDSTAPNRHQRTLGVVDT